MSQVAITKANEAEKQSMPIFTEIAKRFDAIRQRAFDLFKKRGCATGHELEDWLKAEHELMGWPAAELAEKDGAYQMEITLPGFKPEGIEVTASPNEIIVHAATQEEKKTEKENVLWTEFGSNDVYRYFDLPASINPEKVTANLEDGLLKINAPKMEEHKIEEPKLLQPKAA